MYELGYRPKEIYSLLMKDIYLIFHGRNNKQAHDQIMLRNVSAIVSDVFNQTMGGNGAREAVFKMWPMPGDESGGSVMTRDERKAIIELHKKLIEEKKRKDG
jgi:hypothetical protein